MTRVIIELIAVVFSIAIIVGAAAGYIKNVYALVQLDFQTPYRAEIIRTIGLFPPVGIVAGYMKIEDGNESK